MALYQSLTYINTDLYVYGKMELVSQRCFLVDSVDSLADCKYYFEKYRTAFAQKKYSELHIMLLRLDPANGETVVEINEFSQNPLKTRTVINAIAATAPKKSKPIISFDEEVVEEDEELVDDGSN